MILLHHAYGQLANRMILIIHFTAYCLDRKVSLRITNFEQYMELFEAAALKSLENQSITFCRRNVLHRIQLSLLYRLGNVPKMSRLINIRQSHDVQERTFDLKQLDDLVNNHHYLLPEGWLFRCTELTEQHRKDIVQLFQPNNESKEKINVFLKQIPLQRIKVGIHIRRRDYREFLGGKYFYDDETYLTLIDQFEALLKGEDVQFIVFSDEPVSEIISQRDKVLISENDFIEDFFLLSKCDYVLGPPSTFSLVSSYIGGNSLYHIENAYLRLEMEKFYQIKNI